MGLAGVLLSLPLLWFAGQTTIRANVWNADDILTMLRIYHKDHNRYPSTLAELEPYNFSTNNVFVRRTRAQNLKRNAWGRRLIYSSDGSTYTLISPGLHGFLKGRLIPWPEFDGPHHVDTSMIFQNNKSVFLAVRSASAEP